jgi:hypothetical protein
LENAQERLPPAVAANRDAAASFREDAGTVSAIPRAGTSCETVILAETCPPAGHERAPLAGGLRPRNTAAFPVSRNGATGSWISE